MTENSGVREPVSYYVVNASRVRMVRDLLEGTHRMRLSGTTYLPRWPAEEVKDHEDRVDEAVLFNGFKKAIKGLTGKVFRKPIELVDPGRPEIAEAWSKNIDLKGRTLNQFFKDQFENGLADGKTHTQVEMPPPLFDENGNEIKLSYAEESEDLRRPYLVAYPWLDVIGWRYKTDDRQQVTMTQIRVLRRSLEDEGEFGSKTVERVRVLEPGKWTEYAQEDSNGAWAVVGSGTYSIDDRITMRTFYTNYVDTFEATPYLEDLGYLNVTHWQSTSDQRNVVHVVRVPVWFGAGFQDTEGAFEAIGSGLMVTVQDPNGKFGLSETNGKAAEIGWQDLDKLELQMEIMALEPLVKRDGAQETATAKKIDSEEAESPLQQFAMDLESHVNWCLRDMEQYAGLNPGDLGDADVNKEFSLSSNEIQLLQIMKELRMAGDLSRETMLKALQRAEGLTESWKFEEEEERIQNEGPVFEPLPDEEEITPPSDDQEDAE